MLTLVPSQREEERAKILAAELAKNNEPGVSHEARKAREDKIRKELEVYKFNPRRSLRALCPEIADKIEKQERQQLDY